MRPVVRFLLGRGVSWSEFRDLSKEIYVDVARQENGIDGRPMNNSRVAMLTGLSRREVSRVRDRLVADASEEDRPANRIAQILTGWHVDPEFTDAAGHPIDLLATGQPASLSSLLKRYAGDLPHTAIRKELLHRGLIQELDDGSVRVIKRDVVYANPDPEIVRQLGVALHDHGATLEHNLDDDRESPARFEGIADNVFVPVSATKDFGKYVEGRGLEFLKEIDAWLANHEVADPADTATRKIRLGVGVYLIQDEN